MKFPCFLLSLLLSACASLPTPAERRALADRLAIARGWRAETIRTSDFDLQAYLPARQARSDVLTVYVEGDGLAWLSPSQPSSDPTPRDPLALRLALAQPEGNAAYLARPCQFQPADSPGCSGIYWTESRFASEVVAATNSAIDTLKARTGAKKITLVGYSGGGAVAALVAARRGDVERLITVAGNLNHRAWTSHHRVHPLNGSLNPADEADALSRIWQWHWLGGRDKTIPPGLGQDFANLFAGRSKPVVRIEPEFDHSCCWVEKWPMLWEQMAHHF
ncbi:MAG: alpha/beta hydrolase [Gammaproteobacteria bacterium]|nr:alpha/beta hydrolase [Gammaproteobacteria bacterium]MBU1602990.1 alpha/beta hydrolase [Gammaproteobacteria bacterium]MBU2434082.1 alpha/beta hydrolase [Gammaproteobacteria bacterium]MBU2448565.1 alpha/beta hydrolase [Gammaproteobacteria bacterium]